MVVGALLGVGELSAQYATYMRSGRPGQAIGTYCVGAGVLQLQQGFTYQRQSVGVARINDFTNNNVVRYGLTRDFEVSAVVSFRQNRSDIVQNPTGNPSVITGLSGTQIGFRYNVTDESENVPSIAIQTRFLLRAQSEEFRRANTGATTILAAGKGITDNLALTSNLGFTHSGNAAGINPFYSLVVGYSIAQKVEVFVEGYGTFNEFDLNVDGGFGYFIRPDLKLDIFGGAQGFGDFEGDLPSVEGDWFVSAGVSWRVGGAGDE